jgi:hypothetical protein
MTNQDGFHDPGEPQTQKERADELIKQLIAEDHPRQVIVAELVDEGVPASSAYRWVNAALNAGKRNDTGAALCFVSAQEAFQAIVAEDDNKETLKAALQFAQVLKALGRS